MKTVVLNERSRDPKLHIETPLGIVNITIGLHDADGRRVVSVETIPNDYVGEPKVTLDGYGNTRLIEETPEEDAQRRGDISLRPRPGETAHDVIERVEKAASPPGVFDLRRELGRTPTVEEFR